MEPDEAVVRLAEAIVRAELARIEARAYVEEMYARYPYLRDA